MRNFILILFLFVFSGVNAQLTYNVKRAAKAPVVDGVIDELDPWGTEWQPLNNHAPTNTTTASTGRMQMMTSNDIGPKTGFIYILVEVKDNTPNNSEDIVDEHDRDCIEIFFCMSNVPTADGFYKEGDWNIKAQREREPANGPSIEGATGGFDFSALLSSPDWEFVSEPTGSMYTMEFAIPVSVLAEETTFDGINFRFDLKFVDNTNGKDKGRTQQDFWNTNATDAQWTDTRTFGKAVIVGGTTNLINIDRPEGTAFVRFNELKISNVNGAVVIYDLRGTLLRKAIINGQGSIDITDMNTGMYIVKGVGITAKFIK